MRALLPLLIGKSVTLAGAVTQTIGVLTFLTFESLVPYRWHLILGGTALIAVSEGAIWLFYRRRQP